MAEQEYHDTNLVCLNVGLLGGVQSWLNAKNCSAKYGSHNDQNETDKSKPTLFWNFID